MIKKLKRYINARKNEKMMFYYAKQYLNMGIYYFDYLQNELKKLNNIFDRRILHSHICFFNSNPIDIGGGIKFLNAREKFLILINNIAYTFPYSIDWYNHIKRKYSDYGILFSYPHAKLISFNDKRRVLLIERVTGKTFNDIRHHKEVIQKMIGYALIASSKIDQYKYLQHGDVNIGNIIWVNDKNPVFIDLDNIDYLPFLFDIIHYSAGCLSAKKMVSILDENVIMINQLFEKFRMTYSRYYLDCVFVDYVKWYLQYCPDLGDDFFFLVELEPSEFGQTNWLINKVIQS